MADDKVQIIIGTETPPANYKTAHPIGNGDKVILIPPEGGCVVYFTLTPTSVDPPVTPADGIYSLAYGQNYKFKFDSSTEQMIQYQVGPPLSSAANPSDLNPQAHTVIIGSTKPE